MSNAKVYNSEAVEQEQLMRWAEYASGTHPELKLLFHIPNGGSRNRAEAANLKRQGVKAGVPDLCLPVPKGPYHGLFIEMKVGKNKTSREQKKWLDKLDDYGYATVVCYGWEEAKNIIELYLNKR